MSPSQDTFCWILHCFSSLLLQSMPGRNLKSSSIYFCLVQEFDCHRYRSWFGLEFQMGWFVHRCLGWFIMYLSNVVPYWGFICQHQKDRSSFLCKRFDFVGCSNDFIPCLLCCPLPIVVQRR